MRHPTLLKQVIKQKKQINGKIVYNIFEMKTSIQENHF